MAEFALSLDILHGPPIGGPELSVVPTVDISSFNSHDDPSGGALRIPLTPSPEFFSPASRAFQRPVAADVQGDPLVFASGVPESDYTMTDVHPGKAGPHLGPVCHFAYGGKEQKAFIFSVLPFYDELMELVPASDGRVPEGRRPVLGGREKGKNLYHALAKIPGTDRRVPGKTAEQLVSQVTSMPSFLSLTVHSR